MRRRAVLWIVFFALLLAMAEYGLAIQSARSHRSEVQAEFSGALDHAGRESQTNAGDGNEPLEYLE